MNIQVLIAMAALSLCLDVTKETSRSEPKLEGENNVLILLPETELYKGIQKRLHVHENSLQHSKPFAKGLLLMWCGVYVWE